jgi:site-specific recombinase XerD
MEKEELLLKFKEDLKTKNYSPKSIDSYNDCLKRFFAYVGGSCPERPAGVEGKSLKELNREDILNYQLYLKRSKYSPYTVERYMHSVKGFYKYLEEIFYILVNPCDNLILNKVSVKIPIVLTENEVKRILNQPNTSTLIGIRDRAVLEVLYSTGIRIGEISKVTIYDMDLSSGFLRVNKGKYSKDRFVPLTKAACVYLKEYINKVRPRYTKNRLKETVLFMGMKGKRINKVIIERFIKRYAKGAGIRKRVTAHTFRHTFATHLLDNDVDIFKIQKLLGHSRVSTTQIYTKVSPKQIKRTHSRYHPRERDKNE